MQRIFSFKRSLQRSGIFLVSGLTLVSTSSILAVKANETPYLKPKLQQLYLKFLILEKLQSLLQNKAQIFHLIKSPLLEKLLSKELLLSKFLVKISILILNNMKLNHQKSIVHLAK